MVARAINDGDGFVLLQHFADQLRREAVAHLEHGGGDLVQVFGAVAVGGDVLGGDGGGAAGGGVAHERLALTRVVPGVQVGERGARFEGELLAIVFDEAGSLLADGFAFARPLRDLPGDVEAQDVVVREFQFLQLALNLFVVRLASEEGDGFFLRPECGQRGLAAFDEVFFVDLARFLDDV